MISHSQKPFTDSPFRPGDSGHEQRSKNEESLKDERIRRLTHRYQTTTPRISIERARHYTHSWQATAGQGQPVSMRIATAMKNVYERVTIHIDPDDRIAGTWTENFLGVPIDIERGVFNEVLAAELFLPTMVASRVRSIWRGAHYLLSNGKVRDFVAARRAARASGVSASPLNMRLHTMSKRAVNAFDVADSDRRELVHDLLPYWRGKTVVDRVALALEHSGLYSKDMQALALALPGNTSRQVFMLSSCAAIGSYQGHVIPNYETVLQLGLCGMQAETHQARKDNSLTPEQREFLEAQIVALDGIMVFAKRLAKSIEAELRAQPTDSSQRMALQRMLHVCERVPIGPAESFEEAVQALWTVKTALELAHPVNLHSLGRLDQILYPYFARSQKDGSVDPARARRLLAELLLKIMSHNLRPESNILGDFYHRYLGSAPVTVGGVTSDGSDATNELSYIFVDAAHLSKAVTNVAVRVHPNSPDALLQRVAEHLHDGCSSYALFNDESIIEAMRRRDYSATDARNYAITGCVEAMCPGKTGSMSANALQLNRLLDITLRNGDARIITGVMQNEGPRTGAPESFTSFEELLDAVVLQARYAIDKIVRGSNLRDQLFAQHLPAPHISAFIDGCLQKKTDVTRGGGTYDLSGLSMINSMANLVDSLWVIKILVFEQKCLTLRELQRAVDANFVGHSETLRQIEAVEGKWGNGSTETDALARKLATRLFAETYKHRSYKDAPFVVYLISMITHTIDGRLSIASADGRRAATPYAASGNPYNVERAGLTSTLRSVAALPFEDVMGCAINIKLHPSAVGSNAQTRAKWVALVRTYFKLGGQQLQPTVVTIEELRDAQKSPGKYPHLIVKVGGYSAYFVDLGPEIQDEVIARTEHR